MLDVASGLIQSVLFQFGIVGGVLFHLARSILCSSFMSNNRRGLPVDRFCLLFCFCDTLY